jgi:signal transduction histidine kinase
MQQGVLVVLNNITRIRRLEAEIRRREEESAIGILAAQTAHEIKNPLVTLRTFAELLPTQYDDPDFRTNFAPLVGREVSRINDTVQALLQFARPVEPEFQTVDAHESLQQVFQAASTRNKGQPIRFAIDLSAPDDRVRVDPRLLSLAVDNLLVNAVEATREGQISLRTFNLESEEGPLFCVEVEDSGHGIEPSKIKEVFRPFFTTKPDGSGLGLPQTQRIIIALGGFITLDSVVGRGTRVRLHLPIQKRLEEAS